MGERDTEGKSQTGRREKGFSTEVSHFYRSCDKKFTFS